jgi:hypothetical protein
LLTSIQARIALALGVVFLMVEKPDLGNRLLALGVALIIGLASTLGLWRSAARSAAPA